MKVLVACEFSGTVRDAFLAEGHQAISCDLLPTTSPGPHIQGDVRNYLDWDWDLMVAHPECKYLCNSGVRWLWNSDGSKNEERWQNMREAAEFFLQMLNAPIPRIAVENSIMHKHAIEIIRRRQDQVIQPWQHGHGETKGTCLWLKRLPLIQPTEVVDGRVPRVHFASPGVDRWKERSKILPGVARAFARQWGAELRRAA